MNRPSLDAGTRLGTYEIRDLIGAGGMGEVYRARDTRLDRDVAIKILPEAFASDPERLARFDREAKMLAALNHPNIAGIHGIEDTGTTRALVMELVDGPTLADRIAQGAIPIDEALPIARQIADAVEAAHEQGIVHRDLKPANVKVRDDGTVKVLDFGLAKLAEGGRSASGLPQGPGMTASPTITSPALMTGAGMLLGTAAYMSPEQARGKPVDKRSDVWAFGCVLYEMLTGRRAFEGEDVGETLAAVIKEPPAWSALPRDTPQPVHLVLRGCLEKDARARIGSISAASFLLGQPTAERQAPARHGRALALGGLAGAAALAAVVLIWVALRQPQPAPKPTWYTLASNVAPQTRGLPASVVPEIAAAPDGSWIVYVGPGTGGQTGPLILKRSDQLVGQPLPGTAGARRPFTSPDGQWIGFYQSDGIKKIRAEGGSIQSIVQERMLPGTLGAVWTDDGTIFFARSNIRSGIYRVMHTGGEVEPVTQVNPAALEGAHASPHLLANGRVLLFTNAGSRSGTMNVTALDLQTMQQKEIVSDGARPVYVSTGHLLYVNGRGTLMAVRFDADRVQTTGEPVALFEGIGFSGSAVPQYEVTRTGSLLYATGAVPRAAERTLVWVDRSGKQEPVAGAASRAYTYPRISPDGRLIAVEVRDQGDDLWILDIARGNLQQMTNDPGQDAQPTWLWDSRRVMFSSTRDGPPNLYVQSWDGTGAATRLTTSDNPQYPQVIGSENGFAIFIEQRPGSNDLGLVRLREDGAATSGDARMLFDGPYNENTAAVSFDNRLIAYTSNESGMNEVYARTFPALANRIKVSTAGGTRPVFSRDGRELFYAELGGRIMAVAVSVDGSFGTPKKLFDWPTIGIPGFGRTFDVTPDGRRFLMVKEADEAQAGSSDINIVVNWIETLKQRLPAN
jgi:eukaryotic-like serine/threonine-protein kinase